MQSRQTLEGSMDKGLAMKRLVIGLILLALLSVPASALKYYAYGDSITYPQYNYLIQMQDRYDPGAAAGHNNDGPGMSSAWGLENIGSHYFAGTEYFVILFGNNDIRHNLTPEQTGQNIEGMYNYVLAKGSSPIILIHTLENPAVYGDESRNITKLEAYLTLKDIPFIKIYDAIDTVPNNGNLDGFNKLLVPDGVHPSETGHSLMADYLWSHYPFIAEPEPAITGETLAVFNGGVWVLHNPNRTFIYGQAGDIPLLGDWNGDGKTTIGIYRNGVFYLRNSNTGGVADVVFSYGNPSGDTPFVGDWNGDGTDTVGVNRNGVLYLRNSNTNGVADLYFGQVGGVMAI